MNTKSNTKILALIVIFTALAVALNVYGPKIPYPFAPFLYFQLWEIPIVVAFLLIGPKTGIAVSVINTLILFAVFPGPLPTGPFYNFIAVFSMIAWHIPALSYSYAWLQDRQLGQLPTQPPLDNYLAVTALRNHIASDRDDSC